MDIYAENILDHFRNPRGKGELDTPDVTHTEKNVSCGDALTISMKFDGDVLKEISWEGEGCAISQAGMSLLSEGLKGKTKEELMSISIAHIRELLGIEIGIRREKCAFLCLHTLKNALRKKAGKAEQSWGETLNEIGPEQKKRV